MIKHKTTPSQDIRLSWLGGIVDGEGSIRCYRTKKNVRLYGVVIVNTDDGILQECKDILDDLGIFYSCYLRNNYQHEESFRSRLPCYIITVARKNDTKKCLELLLPYLKGVKQQRALNCIAMLEEDPRREKLWYKHICEKCGDEFIKDRKRTPVPRFCSAKCWHDLAQGKQNPNYRHGKRISGVTTEREAPLTMGEATV